MEFVLPLLAIAVCCTITGSVHATTGAPLAAAQIHARGGTVVVETMTDRNGNFTLTAPPGIYRIATSERGFAPATIEIKANGDLALQIALEPLDSPKLRQIGSVSVDGRLAPIAGTIPAVSLTRADFDALGADRIVDGLKDLPGLTFARPDGGAASAIAVVALRGPDPSESLLTLDGQLLNDGNTGDVDLSRLPVAAFSGVDLTEGLGPEDSNGSNTFGGGIDLISLRPTKEAHEALSFSGGSFGRTETWFNATGTVGRLGYATALDDQNESGYTNQTVSLYSASNPACQPCATPLGSSVASHTALGNLLWSFSDRADISARVFVLGDNRDQSSAVNGLDLVAPDMGSTHYGDYIGPGEQNFAQTLRAYQLRARTPLGSGELTTDLSLSDDNVAVNGGGVSPYDIVHRDERYNGGLTWQRAFATAQFAVGGYTRYESLDFIAPPSAAPTPLTAFQAEPKLGQTIDVLFARGGFEPIEHLRLDGGVFQSRYTTFGSNLDGRFGAIYNSDPSTAFRFNLGTGFRAPLLAERYIYPYSQLGFDGQVFTGQGSPNEKPEHATEYEFGVSHEFSRASTLDFSVYRTNLRNPVEVFYPLAAVNAGRCTNNSYSTPIPACVSYQSNVGNAVYQGAELRFSQRFAPAHLFATARYGLNVAYPKNLDAQFSNPTSGGSLVDDTQFPNIAQQQGSLQVDYADRGWHGSISGTARGNNNELNQPPFVLLDAIVGKKLDGGLDLSLAGTNLTSAVSGHFTQFGAGVPYRGVGQDATGAAAIEPLATDALFIEPFGIRAILTIRR